MALKSLDNLTRRGFLRGCGVIAASAVFPPLALGAKGAPITVLAATPGEAAIAGGRYGKTKVWGYNGQIPGPALRCRQGEPLKFVLENALDEATTVHCHGLRLPNTMDGVPFLTQKAVEPGGSFVYEFTPLDAGTFWYHPHVNTMEQVGRGLAGPLIVDEVAPYPVDRDETWMIDDWRFDEDAQLVGGFGQLHEMAHAGRIGNVPTVNGRYRASFEVRAGERLRLRLINAANARIFGLVFEGHEPWLVALDGHPVVPRPLSGEPMVVAPGMRADLVIDMTGKPGTKFEVRDVYYEQYAYPLAEMVYRDEKPLKNKYSPTPPALPDNPVSALDLTSAEAHGFVFSGGAMGGLRGAEMDGKYQSMRDLVDAGMVWAVNGKVLKAEADGFGEPLLTLKKGRSYRFTLRNDTAWPHPIHLHGHVFKVISRNRKELRFQDYQDTVLVNPREEVDVAFVADNPGDWAFHCHILEHAASGMMGYLRVEG